MTKNLTPILKYEITGTINDVVGSVGRLTRVEISRLRVDSAFQRQITIASSKNVARIARDFDWRKFIPVIGVELPDGTIAVIDGQHRATAAHSRGIKDVPVYLISATLAEAANAFAAINKDVTPVSEQDVYKAQLAGGDPAAVELQAILDLANVKVVAHRHDFAKGETRAVKVLLRAKEHYGAEVLSLVLQCITETGNGNPGCIKGAVVNGIAKAIITKLDYLKPSEIFDAFDRLNLGEIYEAARIEAVRTKSNAESVISRVINQALRARSKAA